MDAESDTLRASYARLQITVENRDYHYLSRFEIVGGKRISQQLSAHEAVATITIKLGIDLLVLTLPANLQ